LLTIESFLGIGDWGLGIGDWGLGIGPNPQSQSPIPNPQSPSPIPNPQQIKNLIKKIDKNNVRLNRSKRTLKIKNLKNN